MTWMSEAPEWGGRPSDPETTGDFVDPLRGAGGSSHIALLFSERRQAKSGIIPEASLEESCSHCWLSLRSTHVSDKHEGISRLWRVEDMPPTT